MVLPDTLEWRDCTSHGMACTSGRVGYGHNRRWNEVRPFIKPCNDAEMLRLLCTKPLTGESNSHTHPEPL